MSRRRTATTRHRHHYASPVTTCIRRLEPNQLITDEDKLLLFVSFFVFILVVFFSPFVGKVASAEGRGQKQKDGDMNGIQCIYKQGCAGNYDKRGHAFVGE